MEVWGLELLPLLLLLFRMARMMTASKTTKTMKLVMIKILNSFVHLSFELVMKVGSFVRVVGVGCV